MEGGPPTFRQGFTCPALLEDPKRAVPVRGYHPLWPAFPDRSGCSLQATGLVRVRSPLLTESRLMSFPPATEMFQFAGFASHGYEFTIRYRPKAVGCPIRRFPDQSLLAAPRNFSQPVTSFIASQCQGIHQMPLRRLILNPHAGVSGTAITIVVKTTDAILRERSVKDDKTAPPRMGPAMPLVRSAGLRSSRPAIRRRPAPQPGEPGNPQKPTWLCDHVLQQINRQKQAEQTAGLSEDSLHETAVCVGCRHASPVRRPPPHGNTRGSTASLRETTRLSRRLSPHPARRRHATNPGCRQPRSSLFTMFKIRHRTSSRHQNSTHQARRPNAKPCMNALQGRPSATSSRTDNLAPPRQQMVEPDGIEPTTSCLQSRRSPN